MGVFQKNNFELAIAFFVQNTATHLLAICATGC